MTTELGRFQRAKTKAQINRKQELEGELDIVENSINTLKSKLREMTSRK